MNHEKDPASKDVMNREAMQDDFWDVSRLLPPSPKTPTYAPLSPRVSPEAVTVEVPAVRSPQNVSASGDSEKIRTVLLPPTGSAPLSFSLEEKQVLPNAKIENHAESKTTEAEPNNQSRLLYSYEPDTPLFQKVEIYAWHSNFHYFDQFIKDAERYASLDGSPTKPEPFFSYFPQYAQLNRRQRAWYLFWRSQIRQGVYPAVDYAYVLLYFFELLNLPVGEEEAVYHRDQMAKVWMAYRSTYPQLDHYACEWLCDYCLIHKLQAPVLTLLPALNKIIELARIKEFYLSAMITMVDGKVNVASAKVLLSHSCQYDYRKSKFYSGENKALFDDIIPRAVAAVFPQLLQRQTPTKGLNAMQPSKVSRDAYVGALCAYQNKRRIETTYTSFSRSNDLRYMIGDMVRHIENRIRASILIRSRLTENFLTPDLRKALDAWLDGHLPSREETVKKVEMNRPRPTYEALYDAPHKEVSLSDAAVIEAQSWETTKILVEAFTDTQSAEDVATDAENEVTQSANEVRQASSTNDVASAETMENDGGDGDATLRSYAPFIRAALDGDPAALRAVAKSLGKMPDALADEINALTADGEIGDIILEDDGMGSYTVIEDYREQVEDLFCL